MEWREGRDASGHAAGVERHRLAILIGDCPSIHDHVWPAGESTKQNRAVVGVGFYGKDPPTVFREGSKGAAKVGAHVDHNSGTVRPKDAVNQIDLVEIRVPEPPDDRPQHVEDC
jgi:hypothetical protein